MKEEIRTTEKMVKKVEELKDYSLQVCVDENLYVEQVGINITGKYVNVPLFKTYTTKKMTENELVTLGQKVLYMMKELDSTNEFFNDVKENYCLWAKNGDWQK